jgi:RimJ/RimL family protein N-acetyltransferase
VAPTPSPLGIEAVIELTAYALILTRKDPAAVLARPIDAFGGVIAPSFLQWLAGPRGWIGTHDALMVAYGRGDDSLPLRHDMDDHPRVRLARLRRTDVAVYGDERGLVTLGRGVHGHVEIGVELAQDAQRNRGLGRDLIAAGLGRAPHSAPVFAAVAPGNAASLRAFLAAGFTPVGAEILIDPAGRA